MDAQVSKDLGTGTKRPTFLTVLCIITFIVSGYYFLEGLVQLFVSNSFDANQWSEATAELSKVMDDADPNARQFLEGFMDAFAVTMQRGIANAGLLSVVQIVAAGLSFAGAFLMFRLRRIGYYTYVGSKVVGIVAPLAILGVNMLTGIMYAFAAVVALLFIVLYGINRKHMH